MILIFRFDSYSALQMMALCKDIGNQLGHGVLGVGAVLFNQPITVHSMHATLPFFIRFLLFLGTSK